MQIIGRTINTMALLVAMALAGCGGGDSAVSRPERQSGPLVVSEFIKQAKQADCVGVRNRLYVIDRKYVFADRAGNCGDMAYSYTLYGATVEALLCSEADSIAGPVSKCSDAAAKVLFDVIVKHRSEADLGLGPNHKVEPIDIFVDSPIDSHPILNFTEISWGTNSDVKEAGNHVIKDQAAWSALWAIHNGGRSAAPAVDFSKSMVLAAFQGSQTSGCYSTAITDVYREDGVIKVRRVDSEPGAGVICTMSITAPFHMVMVERSDARVEFIGLRRRFE